MRLSDEFLRTFISKHKPLSVYILLLLIFLALCSGHIGGDGLWIYLSAESLVLDGDLNLINLPPDFDVKELQLTYNNILEAAEQRKADGFDSMYTKYGLVMILLEVPFYLIGHAAHALFPFFKHDYFTVFFVSLLNCFVSALLGLYVYLFVRDIIRSERRALLITAVFCFGTYIIAYGLKSGFSEPLQGLCIFGAFYHAYIFRKKEERRQLLYSGLLGAAALLTKFYSFIGVGLIGIYVLWLIWEKSSASQSEADPPPAEKKHLSRPVRIDHYAAVLYFIIPLAVGTGILLYNNYSKYGNVFETGYFHSAEMVVFDYVFLHITARAFNLLLSPGKGLLLFAPVVLLSLSGFNAFRRSHREEAVLCFAMFAAFFAFLSVFTIWHGDWSWGPRYLYITMPFLILPVSALLNDELYKKWICKIKICFIIGLLVQLPAVLMNNGDFIRLSKNADFNDYRMTLAQFSPITGGYVRLASAVYRQFTGESLKYPVSSKGSNMRKEYTVDYTRTKLEYVSLEGYDKFDLWIFNIRRVFHSK